MSPRTWLYLCILTCTAVGSPKGTAPLRGEETTPQNKQDAASSNHSVNNSKSSPKNQAAQGFRQNAEGTRQTADKTFQPSPQKQPKNSPQSADNLVIIEKSGFSAKEGLQPVPSYGWFARWKFLSRSVRQSIDGAPVRKARWRYIVVHNSGTRQGNAKAFEFYHTKVRKMVNGLAYHFVIGNGTSSGDGEIEIGSRWEKQINGGHVHSDYLNNIALGICLVGDFSQQKPTEKQLAALEELIRYLRLRVGKTDGNVAQVKAHREINPPRWPTDCPGDEFPYGWLHERFDDKGN